MRTFIITGAALLIASAAHAQASEDVLKRQLEERQATTQREFVMRERVPLESAIKGAPYSAEILVETNQALVDGNRISRKSTGKVYRDGEGRTRREEERLNGEVSISIVDPVAGVSYMLDPANRIAWKTSTRVAGSIMNKVEAARLEERRAEERRKEELERAAAGGAPEGTPAAPRTRSPMPPPPPPPPAERELKTEGPLERRTIEGIAVEGRKNTSTMPAGQIGNEQPITIVSEEWRSPELKVLVMTHHSDPRMGESSYRLTNIIRGEPDPSLFQVPAGYTIRETEIRREARREKQ